MRVSCSDVDSFLANLRQHSPEQVYLQVVYVETNTSPVDDTSPDRAVKFGVSLQASAVLQNEDGGEYILVVGQHCGYDYHDASPDYAGSDRGAEIRKQIEDYCRENGLTVRPGNVSE